MSAVVLYGESEGLLELKKQEILQEYRANGYDVRCIGPKEDLGAAFISSMFDTDPILVVVDQPTKIKGLKEKLANPEGCEVLCIHKSNNLPKLLEGLPTLKMEEEPKYDKTDWAIKFLKGYVKRLGKEIDDKLCRAVVMKVGPDVGILRWEAHKYVMGTEGDEITAGLVKGLFTELADPGATDLLNSILACNGRAFLKACDRLEKSSKSDLTMSVCKGPLFTKIQTSLEVAIRLEAGQSQDTIAEEMNMNPKRVYYLIPEAKAVGLKRLRKMMRCLYECESGVFKGANSTWLMFKVKMLNCFQ
jgi:DNA polymerase III delta subunit